MGGGLGRVVVVAAVGGGVTIGVLEALGVEAVPAPDPVPLPFEPVPFEPVPFEPVPFEPVPFEPVPAVDEAAAEGLAASPGDAALPGGSGPALIIGVAVAAELPSGIVLEEPTPNIRSPLFGPYLQTANPPPAISREERSKSASAPPRRF